MIAAIYIRVSTDEQATSGFSLYGQRDECKKKAMEVGAEEILEFADEGISGSVLERPGLIAALARIRAGGVGWFISYDGSRVSRDLIHQLSILKEIDKSGTKIVFVNGSYSNDTPEDQLSFTIHGAVAQYERVKLRLRSLLGKKAKATQGKLTHSPGLYGYHFDKETDLLSIIDEEARVIKLMFQWFTDENISCYAIEKRLNSMGIASPRGKQWSKQTIQRILANTAYKGTLYICRYDTRDAKLNKYRPLEEKVKRKIRPENEWVPIAVAPIIDDSLWKEAQRLLKNTKRRHRGTRKHEYMLSGLMRCGVCGSTMHGNLISSKGKQWAYYVCTAKSPGLKGKPKCALPNSPAGAMDDLVWDLICLWIRDSNQLDAAINAAFKDSEKGVLHQEIDVLNRQQELLIEERSRLVRLYQKNLLPEVEVEKMLGGVKGQVDQLISLKAELEGRLKRQLLADSEKLLIEELRAKVVNSLGRFNVAEKSIIVNMLVDEIILAHQSISIKVRAPITPVPHGEIELASAKSDVSLDVRHDSVGRSTV